MALNSRAHVHDLVDMVPAARLGAVRELLEQMIDPVCSLADAPFDDEPVTLEDLAAMEASVASLNRNGGVSMEEVLADFGLSMEDFQKMGEVPIPETSRGNDYPGYLVRRRPRRPSSD